VPSRLHELITSLALDRPIVVGHSMSAAFAAMYASAYPTRGLVLVDNGPYVRPFAEFVQRLAPALRGPGFAQVWQTFESTLGLERIPEPTRSLVLKTHEVAQDVIVPYWGMVLDTDPAELQAWIDTQILPKLDVPCLGVFGRPITDGDRERLERLSDVQLEEWPDDGHFVHLVDVDRFASRLRQFIDHCTAGC
jgi:pimeloyl-ACP methyl ester carboxylesterase